MGDTKRIPCDASTFQRLRDIKEDRGVTWDTLMSQFASRENQQSTDVDTAVLVKDIVGNLEGVSVTLNAGERAKIAREVEERLR